MQHSVHALMKKRQKEIVALLSKNLGGSQDAD